MISLETLIDTFCDKTELRKDNDEHIVNDDTQVGIEFAYKQIQKSMEGKQLIDDIVIYHLRKDHPEVYKELCEVASDLEYLKGEWDDFFKDW